MPYQSNDELPQSVHERYSERCQTVWREVWNETYADSGDEAKADGYAYTAANNCKGSTRMTTNTLTFVKETPEGWIYEGLAIPYGGVTKDGQDLTGSHFTKATDLCLDWFPDGGRPFLYRHGFDPEVKAAPVGREIGAVREDDKGRWYRIQIDKAKEYAAEVKQLIDEGVLALSSGAVDHLTKIAAKSGEILVWPWVELSGVPNPANPEALLYPVKSLDAIEHLTIVETAVPEAMKGWLPEGTTQGDLADGDFAWIASDSSLPDSERRKLPYKIHGKVSEAGWRAAWTRAHQAGTDFSGGPSREQVIAKLMRDKPAGVETMDEGTKDAEAQTPAVEEGVTDEGGAAVGDHAAPAIEVEASRHATRDLAAPAPMIQSIHDMAHALGAVCMAEKDAPPAPRLVITGTAAAKDEPDLPALTEAMKAIAIAKAKELLRTS